MFKKLFSLILLLLSITTLLFLQMVTLLICLELHQQKEFRGYSGYFKGIK